MDIQGDIVYANPAAKKLLGYSSDFIININYKVMFSDDYATFNYYFKKAIYAREAHDFELKRKGKNNDFLELQLKIVPNEMEGQIVNVAVYIQDITKRKKAELVILEASKAICESFIENNRDPILLLNLDSTIVLANRAFSRLLGWKKENLEGFHILQCPSIPTHLVKQMRDYYNRVVATEFSVEANTGENQINMLETIRVTNDGKEYQMLLSITPIYDNNDNVCNWAVHLRDITDKKSLEERLGNMVKEQAISYELRQLEHLQTVSNLAASISHEVRNPLTVTRGFIQLLRDSTITDEAKNEYIRLCLEELDRADEIITDYLTFAKPSLENVEILELNSELDYIEKVINPFATMRNIVIQSTREANDVHLLGERKKLHQSLINIIKNGVEAIKDGGEITISLKKRNDCVQLIIKDTGVGMEDEDVKKLGTAYFTTKAKGTGLGTMVAFSLIEAMQGEITVQSEKGTGTTFFISFPIYYYSADA